MGNPTDELRARLDELGVRYTTDDSNDYEIIEWQGPYNLWWQFVYDPYEEEPYGELRLVETGGATHLTPEQAIAATVGMEKWEPSKEWKAWHNSLKHDNPTSICEAVENILYEVIDFGGEMGPNGNVWSGVDEGIVLTENCIDGWVESVESIAATVGVGSNTVEAIRKLLDKLNTELCNAGCVVECETREERQRLIDAAKDKYAQAIATTVGAGTLTAEQVRECAKGVYFEGYGDGATHKVNGIEETDWQTIADKLNATLGAGTCHLEEREHEREIPHDLPDCDGGWYTEVTHDCDECGYENADPNVRFCGGCGRKVVTE